ncbi:MAG: hypothetical protein MUE69_21550 [Myxococcota bacterium]|nr:hypothetical protein [Myxococcota bacterium]
MSRRGRFHSAIAFVLGCGGATAPVPSTIVEAPAVSQAPPAWAPREGVIAFGVEVLVERTGLTLRLESSRSECRALAVRSHGGLRDLDVTLYDANGSLLAADDAPDAHALAQVCGAAPAFARIEARAGAGELSWVDFVGDAAPVRVELGIAGGRAQVDRWSSLDATLRARGFSLRATRDATRIDAGAPWVAPFVVAPARCATLAVQAEGNVRLRLRFAERTIEAEPGSSAQVQVCHRASDGRGRLEVEADASTPLWIATWEGREADVGGDEALWLGAQRPAR